jgi:ubiquinol-cytochrome c reductase cytochrome b subunit
MLTHGVEIGIIRQLPSGEFIEESRPLTDEERAVVESKRDYQALPTAEVADANGVPAPAARGPMGWAREVANRAFTETIVPGEGNGHGYGGNGHGDGHGELGEGEHAAIGAADEGSEEH